MNVEGAGYSASKICFCAGLRVEGSGPRVLSLGCRIIGLMVKGSWLRGRNGLRDLNVTC